MAGHFRRPPPGKGLRKKSRETVVPVEIVFMNHHDAYAIVCQELAEWRELGYFELSTFIGQPAICKNYQLGNEGISVEVRVQWVIGEPAAILIEARALGPSCYRFERLDESVIVRASEHSAQSESDS
jgi:hypothetical protein